MTELPNIGEQGSTGISPVQYSASGFVSFRLPKYRFCTSLVERMVCGKTSFDLSVLRLLNPR
jgi:hypothetical protein